MIDTTCAAQAWVCWTMSRGHFIRFGGRFFDRHGSEIPHDDLHTSWSGEQCFRTCRELGVVESLEDALVWLNARYVDCGYDLIFLADNEWGNETMWAVAQEHFAANPDCQFVEVSEHAGWWLCFRRDGSVWNTANDMAVLSHPLPVPSNGIVRSIRR